ncbi:MAG: aminopeptidase P family protein [bacterium]|nr:aminopeptidase P family protein [bacterium]
MKLRSCLLILILILTGSSLFAQDIGVTAVNDIQKILPERERAEIVNGWLEWRLENILPDLMKREGIEMWIVINREYNEDPVYLTLVPEPNMAARRTSILIFHDNGETVDRYSGSFYGMGNWYQSLYSDRNANQFEVVADFIKEKNPRNIGLNFSDYWAFGDGLSASHKAKLEKYLGSEYSKKIVSAENLAVSWLETRSPQELSVYRHICGIAHDIIAEFFSNEVITPDVTTAEEVRWWIRQKITSLGLETWFHPSVDIQRSPEEAAKYPDRNTVIRRGDLLHCDIGIVYMRLCTDTQELAYVCKIGEDDAPEGIKEALRKGNRLQDIFMSEFREGRTGNDVLSASLRKAKAEGLNPSIYTHPLGFHGHAAGTTLGMWDKQEGVPVNGDFPLHYNTCYAIELNNRYSVPEWGGFEVRIGLEEGGVFTKDGCKFIDGRMENYYIIK